ncbi:hypothetical protein Y1Q_0023838 [Alligator mississippiensis]|uniref:Uncharacterized protein n=1 Tax=Alligator mississippiensis TaxID=8496 RepID=A0A151MKE0_ALLMI|nr:hypothetical protein Y1Q_0023838 [Alligator mississippiensis]
MDYLMDTQTRTEEEWKKDAEAAFLKPSCSQFDVRFLSSRSRCTIGRILKFSQPHELDHLLQRLQTPLYVPLKAKSLTELLSPGKRGGKQLNHGATTDPNGGKKGLVVSGGLKRDVSLRNVRSKQTRQTKQWRGKSPRGAMTCPRSCQQDHDESVRRMRP